MDYAAWKHAVDGACWHIAGLGIDDLDDCPLADWYADDISPARAARRAIRNAGGEAV